MTPCGLIRDCRFPSSAAGITTDERRKGSACRKLSPEISLKRSFTLTKLAERSSLPGQPRPYQVWLRPASEDCLGERQAGIGRRRASNFGYLQIFDVSLSLSALSQ